MTQPSIIHQQVQCNKGFTLVEFLIYMGIFSILLVILLQLFTSIIEVSLESQTSSGLNQDGRFILARLTHDVRLSSTITTPDSHTLTLVGSSENLTYSLSSGNLVLKNNTTNTSDQLNGYGTKVSAITYSVLWDGVSGHHPSVQIVMTITSSAVRQNGSTRQQILETTIGTR